MRHSIPLVLATLAAALLPAPPAAAQHGLLHKHRHIAAPGAGTMRPLPAQAAPSAAAAATGVTSSDGSTITVATVPSATGSAAGAAPGMPPVCAPPMATLPVDGLPIDAVPMPLPSIDGAPPIACPIDPSTGASYLPPPMFIGGRPDASGPPVGGGVGGPIAIAMPGTVHPGRPPHVFDHHRGFASPGPAATETATALSASVFGQTTTSDAISASAGRSAAAGLPGRAVGIRPGPLDVPGRHSMTPIGAATATGATAAAPGAAGPTRDAGVVQAAGVTPHRDAHAGNAAAFNAPGMPSSTPAAPPRWRDRLRFAWPTGK